MLFTEPLPFKDALASAKVKAILPTNLTSEQLSQLPAAVRERSLFSARVANTSFLDELQGTIGDILEPFKGPRGATEGLGLAEARLQLTDVLDRFNYVPDAPETITDLSSDQRLNLILETQTKMARGYGQWAEGQDESILDAWPAQELYRGEDRKEPRDWPQRWQEAGGTLYESPVSDYPEGRMIALKNDPIWEEISAFGLPYPPFDFNSGMDIRDISRQEAEQLGILTGDEAPEPQERDFAKDLEASVDGFSPKLLKQLLKDVGSNYKVSKGVLVANSQPGPIDAHNPSQEPKRAILGGLLFRIENPKGTVRTGTDKDGRSWAVALPADYGYVSDVEGADGDEVDAFLGDAAWSTKVWIADMVDPETGLWDEHKCFVGFADEQEVRTVLREAYDDGAKKDRVGSLTEMGLDEFHLWLHKGIAKDEPLANADCGTGAGGFKPGNKCATGIGKIEIEETMMGGKPSFVLHDPDDPEIIPGHITLRQRPDGDFETHKIQVGDSQLDPSDPPDPYQRRGLGTHLYKRAAAYAKSRGKKLRVSGEVSDEAKALHAKLREQGVLKDDVIDFGNELANAFDPGEARG